MKQLIAIVKICPIVITLNIIIGLVCSLLHVNISNYTYPIFGHSLYFDILLLYISFKLNLCSWHRVLIYNMILIISLEWMYVNTLNVGSLIYVQSLLLASCLSILISAYLFINKMTFKFL